MSDLVYYGSSSAPHFGGTVVASGALPAGRYLVTVTTLLGGTVAVVDQNNMRLTAGVAANVAGTLVTYTAAGSPFINPTVSAIIPDSGTVGTFQVLANQGTATATAIYYAQMVVRPDAIYGY